MAQSPTKALGITLGELMDLQAIGSHAERSSLVSKICKRNEKRLEDDRTWILIPTPSVAPLGVPVDKKEFVQEVWDSFIKPRQESGELQSAEERVLMAILRAVYEGLMATEVE